LAAQRDPNTTAASLALLIAYEWSTAKEKAIAYYTAQSEKAANSQLKTAYKQALTRVGGTQ